MSRVPAGWRLFALSFVALFLELLLIRWAPSVVRLVAYYANLLLISSFLGLGWGALTARRRARPVGVVPVAPGGRPRVPRALPVRDAPGQRR